HKHDITRERPLADLAEELAPDPPGPGPSPSQVAMANERWERLVAGQPPHLRQFLDLLRQGHTQREAADRLGLHPKCVQRLLRRPGGRLEGSWAGKTGRAGRRRHRRARRATPPAGPGRAAPPTTSPASPPSSTWPTRSTACAATPARRSTPMPSAPATPP